MTLGPATRPTAAALLLVGALGGCTGCTGGAGGAAPPSPGLTAATAVGARPPAPPPAPASSSADARGSGGAGNGGGRSGGSGRGGSGAGGSAIAADVIQVGKCWTNATANRGGELLIQASSSDPTATLTAYRPDGSPIGPVQNAGGGRYGGTVMPYQSSDPGRVTVVSSSGGRVTVPTAPFQPEN